MLLELSHIAKSFGRRLVLSEINLCLNRGEILCITGPSGCGKTTLLEIIAGILSPDSGTRKVETDRIGYAFQDDCLIPWKTAEENICFALPSLPLDESKARSASSLSSLGLADAGGKKPAVLSGGMRRRLNISRSLAVEPELLLLDEPFAFQDEETIELIRQSIFSAHRSFACAVVIVSHDLGPCAGFGGKVYSIESSNLR